MRYIPAIILILLGIGLFFAGQDVISLECSGIGWVNPLCWGIGSLINLAIELLFTILAIIFVIMGIILMILSDPEQRKWFLPTLILLILTVINFLVPDPVPFIDEMIMLLLTSVTGFKMITPKSKAVKKIGVDF